jgi:hypothetical protein
MVEVEIIIPRKWLKDRVIKRQVPSEWNELSAEQLCVISEALHSGKLNTYEFNILMVKVLFGLKWFDLMAISDRIVDLKPFFAWVLEKNTLTRAFITQIDLSKRWRKYFKSDLLYGPVGSFETLKAREWTHADTAFMAYCQSKDIADLDEMIAILFRKRDEKVKSDSEDFKGDYRVPYNDFTVSIRKEQIKNVPEGVKYAILTWYMGCRAEWESLFERVFTGSGESAGVESWGWAETIQKIAGPTFGSLEYTENTYMWKLLMNMEITMKDQAEAKAEADRQRQLARR